MKGVEGFNRSSPVSGPTFVDATEGGKRLRRGARLWTVAVSTFKAETYRFLRLARPTDEDMADGAAFPPGSVHLRLSAGSPVAPNAARSGQCRCRSGTGWLERGNASRTRVLGLKPNVSGIQ